MGRAKVPMKLITCERSRNRVFQNRRKGLAKKCMELSVLCGIDVCMISLAPPGRRRFEAETYPKGVEEVKRIVEEYQQRGVTERGKKQHTLAGMLGEKARNLEQELQQLEAEANGRPSKPLLSWDEKLLDSMTEEALREMAAKLDAKLASVGKEIELRNSANIVLVGKTEPADPQSNYALNNAIVEQINMGWNQIPQQILPCKPMNPYGHPLHGMVDLHQVQPLSVSYQGSQYPYAHCGHQLTNCINCSDYSLQPFSTSNVGSSSNAFGGMEMEGSSMNGFNSFQDAFSFADASFGFPNYNGPNFF